MCMITDFRSNHLKMLVYIKSFRVCQYSYFRNLPKYVRFFWILSTKQAEICVPYFKEYIGGPIFRILFYVIHFFGLKSLLIMFTHHCQSHSIFMLIIELIFRDVNIKWKGVRLSWNVSRFMWVKIENFVSPHFP